MNYFIVNLTFCGKSPNYRCKQFEPCAVFAALDGLRPPVTGKGCETTYWALQPLIPCIGGLVFSVCGLGGVSPVQSPVSSRPLFFEAQTEEKMKNPWVFLIVAALMPACATVSQKNIEKTNTIRSWKELGRPGISELAIEQTESGRLENDSVIRGIAVSHRKCPATYFDEKSVELYQERTSNGLAKSYLLGIGVGGAGGALLGTAHLQPETEEDDDGKESHPRRDMYIVGSIAATVGAGFLINAIITSIRSVDRSESMPNRTDSHTGTEVCMTEPLRNTPLFASEPDLNLHNVAIGQTDGDGEFKFDVRTLSGFRYPATELIHSLELYDQEHKRVGTLELGDWLHEPIKRVNECDTVGCCEDLTAELERKHDGRYTGILAKLESKLKHIRFEDDERPYQNAVTVTVSEFNKASNYEFKESKPYLEFSDDRDRIYVRQDRTTYEHMDGIEYTVKLDNTSSRYMLADFTIDAKAMKCMDIVFARECGTVSEEHRRSTALIAPNSAQKITGFISVKASVSNKWIINKIRVNGQTALTSQMSIPPQFNAEMENMFENNFDIDSTESAIQAIESAEVVNGNTIVDRIRQLRAIYSE